MGHLVGKAQFFHSRRRVAAADDGDSARFGYRFGHFKSAFGETVEFKYAHRPVPYHGAGRFDGIAEQRDGFGPNVQAHPAVRHFVGVYNLHVAVFFKGVAHLVVNRQQEFHAFVFGFLHHLAGKVQFVLFAKRGADVVAHGFVKV